MRATAFSRHKSTDYLQATLNKLPAKRLTEEMVTLKAAIDEHFVAPELIEAFEGAYAVHPDWEMLEWFMEKMDVRMQQGKQDTPMEYAGDDAEDAEK